MTDAEIEAVVDRRVQRRLAADRAYLNAENADEQAWREHEITIQEEDRFRTVDGVRPDGPETMHGGLIGQGGY